jgi:hypothetical protein
MFAYLWLTLIVMFSIAVLSVRQASFDESMYKAGRSGPTALSEPAFPLLLKLNVMSSIIRNADLYKYVACLQNEHEEDIMTLTVSLVAVENYVRPSWLRNIEFLIAEISYYISGTVPDFSLGIAQIKLSTVRKINSGPFQDVKQTWNDYQLLKYLKDDCQNIKAAFEYIEYLTKEISNAWSHEDEMGVTPDLNEVYVTERKWQQKRAVIATYNGQSATGTKEKSLGASFYNEVTTEVYRLMNLSAIDEVRHSASHLPTGDTMY